MVKFIDAHSHLDMIEKPDEVVTRAKDVEVNVIIANGVNPSSNRKVLSFSAQFNEVKAALGLYPIDALSMTDKEIDEEIDFIRNHANDIVALGEVGMDFKEDTTQHDRQEIIFRKIVSLAEEINVPLIIHSRKAEKEIITILKEMKAKKVVMHCFSGRFNLVKEIIDAGWSMTIPTSVVNSEHFQKIIKETPLNQLLCETDSPYLHPLRLWPNEPSLVIASYQKIAEIKGMSLDEIVKQVEENYIKLFGNK